MKHNIFIIALMCLLSSASMRGMDADGSNENKTNASWFSAGLNSTKKFIFGCLYELNRHSVLAMNERMPHFSEINPHPKVYIDEKGRNTVGCVILQIPYLKNLQVSYGSSIMDISEIPNLRIILGVADFDLSQCGVQALLEQVPHNLVALSIDDVNILEGLNYKSFENLQEFTMLQPQFNAQTQKICIPAFLAVAKIDCSELSLKSLPLGLVVLPNLTELILHHNKIEDFNGLEKLTQLKSLDISFNELSAIPWQLNALIHLKDLNIYYNSIDTIEISLPALVCLDMGHNNFKKLPDMLNDCTTLTNLKMGENPFTDWQGLEKIMPYLYRLNLGAMKLTMLPDLKSATQLTKLSVSANMLQTAESLNPILDCTTLTKLDLRHNIVTDMEEYFKVIGQMAQLESLNIAFTDIRYLPASLVLLTKLTSLAIDNNIFDMTHAEENKDLLISLPVLSHISYVDHVRDPNVEFYLNLNKRNMTLLAWLMRNPCIYNTIKPVQLD